MTDPYRTAAAPPTEDDFLSVEEAVRIVIDAISKLEDHDDKSCVLRSAGALYGITLDVRDEDDEDDDEEP